MTNKTFVLVSIGLVWESAKSGSQHIRDVVNSIGTSLDLSEVRYTYTWPSTANHSTVYFY